MILVDTSIWIDHLDGPHPNMLMLLGRGEVLMHPFVFGEIAMGSLRKRKSILETLSRFKVARIARHEEVLTFTAIHKLFGKGIGYVDAHLLTSVTITPGTMLWTRDKRLLTVAMELKMAYTPMVN